MFRIAIALVTLLLSLSAICQENRVRERRIEGKIVNFGTGRLVSDSIKVELLTSDSTVIGSGYNHLDERLEYQDGREPEYIFQVPVRIASDSVTVRLTHPDYATVSYPVRLSGINNDAGNLRIRRLTGYEKGRMLGEVVVKASVLQVVHKGDTLQYNADAFDVAQGSMLDALIEQLPGVELREGGRLYVNGRFVDKLLLDGKDFFEGDNFVLLQNLPAYTVRNIKVYEQASASKEVFGRSTASDPNPYVMDVTLRKGYNTGWMANAEAGGGTHSRYRGRAFGLGYTSRWRLGAFGYMNNMNETRNPGRDGDWSPAESQRGRTTSKAAGVSYGYFPPARTAEFTGNTSAQYNKNDNKTLSNIQNFLPDGDTYTRRWNDNLDRTFEVNTSNRLTLRPKEGHRYRHNTHFEGSYSKGKSVKATTEGQFGRNIGDVPDLRERLNRGWVEGMDGINRYLAESESRLRNLNASLGWSTLLSLPHDNGLSLIAYGSLTHSDNDGPNFSDYLLQYSDRTQISDRRSNPQSSRGFNYNFAVQLHRPIGPYITITPRIDLYYTYEHKRNRWFTDADTIPASRHMLPSMRAETMLRLDPRNSYVSGRHYRNLRPWFQIGYERTYNQGEEPGSNLFAFIDAKANILRDFIDFNGYTRTRAGKNYVDPAIRTGVTYNFSRFRHTLAAYYELGSYEIDVFNLLDDVTFTSDPLNHRTGNPDLKSTRRHTFNLRYSVNDWLFGRLMFYTDLWYVRISDDVAMSYSYDSGTGVRTYRPININGNWYGNFYFIPKLALDRNKRFLLEDRLILSPKHVTDMISYDGFATTQRSTVNSLGIEESLSLRYSVSRFSAALEGQLNTQRSSSAEGFFAPFRVSEYRYGFRGRVSLPAGFEVSTDMKMYSKRGYEYKEMNTNQLVWNARVSKTLLNGRLMLFLDGYDILGRVKSISYFVNSQGRTERWVNNIPSYVMFSIRWNFAKKPRQ